MMLENAVVGMIEGVSDENGKNDKFGFVGMNMRYRMVELGTLINQAKTVRCGNGDYPVLSMTMRGGLVFQDEKFKKVIASNDRSEYKVVYRNQLVISFPIDEGVLATQRIVDAGIVSPAYGIWDIDQEKILPEFLECALRCPRSISYYKAKLRGSTARRRSLPTSTLLEHTIPLPSLEEQEHILTLIHRVSNVVALRGQELEHLDDLVKARFVELFGCCQCMVPIDELCSIITDGTHQPPKFQDDGIPFIFVSNLVKNAVTYNTEKFISEETYSELYKRTPLEVGDLLLSTVGSYGHPAVVVEDRKFLFQRHIAYLKPKRNIVNSFYLHAALLSPDSQRQIEEKVKGIAQKTLNLSEIKKILIPLPSIEDQNAFEVFVKQTDKSKVAIQAALDEAQLLFDSLMQKYFG